MCSHSQLIYNSLPKSLHTENSVLYIFSHTENQQINFYLLQLTDVLLSKWIFIWSKSICTCLIISKHITQKVYKEVVSWNLPLWSMLMQKIREGKKTQVFYCKTSTLTSQKCLKCTAFVKIFLLKTMPPVSKILNWPYGAFIYLAPKQWFYLISSKTVLLSL